MVALAAIVVTPSLASAHELLTAPASAMTLDQAPKALQAAVQHTIGEPSSPAGWSQHQELPLPSDAAGFGQSVAISGTTAIVGTQGSIGTGVGAAYIFVTDGTTWSEQAELTPSDGTAGDLFGWSVAISGRWVVVGAFGGPNYSAKGAAYVFVRSGTTWSQQAKLTASDAENGDEFGISVAISGSTAVVGAALESSDAGAAYVFVRAGEEWSQKAELKGSPNARFGYSVSISNAIVVVGAPEFPDTGSAYVFVPQGGTWVQQAELTASDGASFDYFGVSVAISRRIVVVGADDRNNFTGAAYVFVPLDGTWVQQGELTAPDGGGRQLLRQLRGDLRGRGGDRCAGEEGTVRGGLRVHSIGPELDPTGEAGSHRPRGRRPLRDVCGDRRPHRLRGRAVQEQRPLGVRSGIRVREAVTATRSAMVSSVRIRDP